MLKNIKRFRFIIVGLILIFLVTSIFISLTPKNSEVYGSTKKVTLKLLIDKDTDRSGIEAIAKKFEKKTGIKTEFEIRPGGLEGENYIRTRLAAGEMADLSWFNSGALFQTLNPPTNFVDLTKESFMKRVEDSFKKVVSVNGKVYAIPGESATAGVWLYNKKVYQKLNLKVPKTWQELMANCEKIKKAGITAVIGSYKDSWTSQLIHLADYYNVAAQVPDFADKFTANKVKYATTPAMLRSFEKLQEVYKKGYLNKDFLSTTYDKALKMLVDGKGAHYPMLTFALTAIYTNYKDRINDIGAFPQPSDSPKINGVTLWMPAGISIYKKSKYIAEAKKWCEFYISDEGIKEYLTKIKPTGPFVIKGLKINQSIYYPAVRDLLPYIESGKVVPALEFLTPVKGPNLPQICVEIGSGMITPKKGAEMYDKDVEKQAKQLGLKGW